MLCLFGWWLVDFDLALIDWFMTMLVTLMFVLMLSCYFCFDFGWFCVVWFGVLLSSFDLLLVLSWLLLWV